MSDTSSPLSLWIDADPSGLVWTGLDCDDDLAMLVALALERRGEVRLEGLSVCGGNAPLRHTWTNAQRLSRYVGVSSSLPAHVGRGWRSMRGVPRWLARLDRADADDAADALVERSRRTDDDRPPLTILALGPPTNLARAIEKGLDENGVRRAYLMGGELTGTRPLDLNLRSDPAAARVVLESGLPTTIVPIQTCGQVVVTRERLEREYGRAADAANADDDERPPAAAVRALLPKMRLQAALAPRLVNGRMRDCFRGKDNDKDNLRWTPSPNLDRGFVPWDVVALLAVVRPRLFDEWEHHTVTLEPCCDDGDDVRMSIADAAPSRIGNASSVVRVPHLVVNETRLLDEMFQLLSEVPPAANDGGVPPPSPAWGFLEELASASVVGVITAFLWVRRRRR